LSLPRPVFAEIATVRHPVIAGRRTRAGVVHPATQPVANLQQIFQQPNNMAVPPCGIVDTGWHTFRFEITAAAPLSHLRGWSLTAYWGTTGLRTLHRTATLATSRRAGYGPAFTSTLLPPSHWEVYQPGAGTSIHCAHTFFLRAWDRVIKRLGLCARRVELPEVDCHLPLSSGGIAQSGTARNRNA